MKRGDDPQGDAHQVGCLVCGRPHAVDAGGEIRFAGNRRIYICSTCLPSWRASELWNQSNPSRGQGSGLLSDEMRKQIGEKVGRSNVVNTAGEEDGKRETNNGMANLRSSAMIKAQLDRFVVGQEDAKMALSVIAHRHYLRVAHRLCGDEVSANAIQKQNVLIVGPTGSGKTLMIRKLAEILGVPSVIAASTSYTEVGYQGNSTDDVFRMLMIRSAGDGSERFGMIAWDEVDKIARREVGGHRDVSGLGVQQGLLDQLEPKGSIIDVPGTKQGQRVSFDTKDVFFVLMGCFSDGLEEIVEKRIGGHSRMGFGRSSSVEKGGMLQITDEDCEAYGFSPEFMSRVGHIIILEALERSDLRRVLLDIEDAPIRSAIATAAQYGFILKFDESAIEAIISRSLETRQGSRKLASMVDRAVLPAFFEVPGRVARRKTSPVVTISSDTVEDPHKFHVR